MMDFISTEALVALLTLTSLEVVLGVDNVIFIAILAGKLPESQPDYARKMGASLLAVASRAILVLAIGLVMRLNQPYFPYSVRGFPERTSSWSWGDSFCWAKRLRRFIARLNMPANPNPRHGRSRR